MKKLYMIIAIIFISNILIYSQFAEIKKDLQEMREKIKETTDILKVTDEFNHVYLIINDEDLTKYTFETILKNKALVERTTGLLIGMDDFKNYYSGVLYRGKLKIKTKIVRYKEKNLITQINFINYEDDNKVPLSLDGYFNCKNGLGGQALHDVIANYNNYNFANLTSSRTKNHDALMIDMDLMLTYSKIRVFSWTDIVDNVALNEKFTEELRLARNQYSFSVFSKTGSDQINLPFWFKGSSAVGIDFFANYNVDTKAPSDLNNSWGGYIGYDQPIYGMHTRPDFKTSNTFFKKMKLFALGDNLLLGGEYNNYDWHFAAEASININERKREHFIGDNITDFTAIKTYYSVSAIKNKIKIGNAELFNAGLSASWFSTADYTNLKDLDGKPFKTAGKIGHGVLSPEVGIKISDRLFSVAFSTQYNFVFSDGAAPYHYVVFKSNLMFNNFIGIDVKFFRVVVNKKLIPSWHYEDYLIFSPVIKIAF